MMPFENEPLGQKPRFHVPWKLADRQKLIDYIVSRVRRESPFSEKSEYTIETLRRVLEEEL